MIDGRRGRRRLFRFQAVQLLFENRAQALIAAHIERDGARGGGLHPRVRILLAQPDDAQAGAVALLGMAVAVEDAGNHCGRVRADAGGPIEDARGAPFQMPLVGLGPVLVGGAVLVGKR